MFLSYFAIKMRNKNQFCQVLLVTLESSMPGSFSDFALKSPRKQHFPDVVDSTPQKILFQLIRPYKKPPNLDSQSGTKLYNS
jgi:hypothetical protein